MVRPLDMLRAARAVSLRPRLAPPSNLAIPRSFATTSATASSSSSSSSLSSARMHSSARAFRSPTTSHTTPQSPLVPRPTATGYSGAGNGGAKRPNAYTVWYREILPSMIPIFVLSTAIFLALSLVRTHLSHARSLEESGERIAQLEAQLARLRAEAKRRQERERRERERILPLVVERVLQRVGAIGEEEDEDIEVEDRLLV